MKTTMRVTKEEKDFLRQVRNRGVKELRSQRYELDTDYPSGVPQPLPFADINEAYAIHVWVYACVRQIATACASVDILPYIQDNDGSWALNEKHPFHRLLQNPNPYMTARNLREFAFMVQALTGNAYYALERMGGKDVKEIWPLPAGSVKPVSTKEKFVDHYVYDVGGVQIRFEADEIIHFRDSNPNSMHYGQGATAPVINAITADLNAIMWNKSFFAHGAKLDGVLESKDIIETDTKRKLELAWKKMFTGASNAGKTAILDGGITYKQLTANIKDMDFVGLRKQVRDEILAAFNVPPSVVGLLEFANYSNMKEQMRAFWTNTVIPRLQTHAEMLTLRAQQLTGDKKTVFQADTSTVEALRTNETERATTTKTYVDAGIPINQIIRHLDLPFDEVEGGDEPRQPAAPVAPSQPPEPPEPPAKGVKTLKATTSEQDEAIKDAAWKSFDSRLVPHEERFISSTRAFFKGQRRRVLKGLEDNAAQFTGKAFKAKTKALEDTVRLIFDIDREKGLMEGAVGRHISGAYFDFAVSMAQSIKPGFNFNLDDPAAQAWIDQKKVRLVQEANAYTLEQISDAVVEGVEQAVAGGFGAGETIAQIADRIEEVYKFAVDVRAERIARTEVISAANAGAFDGMGKTGVERKGWLSSRDQKVRETHKAIEDAGSVGIHDSFVSPSGAVLQFPGDPAAGPEEIINCRCTVVAR